ncbi:MAG: 2-phospho-L-lactate/phosphoenolpyruvate guanylyltransferase [Solirubrobacteraceae bacterium]|nr:2-phospho-L-lactate/phosphoenolpyruvate guanylyltransferase [Solirubrobacteraceae bacterium]
MRTAAILPVKRFDRAKSRLGASVADTLRGQLARAMVADVLQALAGTATIERTIVVTCEPSVRDSAAELRALVVPDSDELSQSAAVALGVRTALAEGFERVLCIPGDCPALDPAELDALLAARHTGSGAAAQVVIVPDRHGTGTNGLLLTPPDAISPSFGPGSCARHRDLAHAAGVSCRVERPPSLLLDIDTGADLAVLRDRLAHSDAPAARTRAVLSQEERPKVLSVVNGD